MSNRILRTVLEGPSLYSQKVAGTSFRTEQIEAILSSRHATTQHVLSAMYTTCFCEAQLVSERDNKHDSNAIAVRVKSVLVGYLPRELALKLTQQIQRMGYDAIDAKCNAVLSSVSHEDGSTVFSVKIDVYTRGQKRVEAAVSGKVDFEFNVSRPCLRVDPAIVKVGTDLKFWPRPSSPGIILLYPKCKLSDEEERIPIGQVPSEYTTLILRHLEGTESYNATIVAKLDDGWQVRVHLETREERLALIARNEGEREARLKRLLNKPYQPRKPVQFTFSVAKGVLRRGDDLEVTALPTLEMLVKTYGRLEVGFCCLRTEQVFDVEIDSTTIEKFIRLSATRRRIIARVTHVERATEFRTELCCNAEVSPEIPGESQECMKAPSPVVEN